MKKDDYSFSGEGYPQVSADQFRKDAQNQIQWGACYMSPAEAESYEILTAQELRKQEIKKLKKKKLKRKKRSDEEPVWEQEIQADERMASEKNSEMKQPKPRENISIPNQGLSLARCAEELCRCTEIINMGNRLYVYNGKCYEPIKPIDLAALYRDRVNSSLHDSKSMKMFTSELYDCLRSDSSLLREMDHTDYSDYAVLENGIYDISKQKLLPHDSRYTALSYVKARYIENPKCEKFDEFLNTITDGDKILKKRFWYFMGYTFSDATIAKKIAFLGTKPNSGKSVFGGLIGAFYPEKFVSNIALTDMNKDFALGPLVGSAVNISLDLPQTRLNNTAVSLIKQLTGNDSITINEKYIPQFKYHNRAKFIFASNHPITISGEDGAFWDRVLYLPFEVSIPRKDQNFNLQKELLQEKDAIVSKALRKSQELWENKFEFPTTPYIERTVNQWRGRIDDSMDRFINTYCELDGSATTVLDDIYRAYCKCCEQDGIIPENAKRLKDYLENQKGLTHKKARCGGSNPRSAMKGIRLL